MELIGLHSGGAVHVAGAGNPVMFLHGVGGGAWSWDPQVQRFSRDQRIFVWEARGHGGAARVSDAGLADYYVDAREALEAAFAGTQRKVTLVGHSMGGLLALALAASYPREVAGLFLIDPVYSDGSDGAYGHFPPLAGHVARFLCAPLLRSFERDGWLSRKLARSIFEQSFENRDRMEAAWHSQRLQVPVEYPKMLRESFVRPEGFELRDFAAEIEAPVFLLDVVRPGGGVRFAKLNDTLQRRLGSRFSHATLNGGHYLQLDRYEEVNRYLEDFLASLAEAA